MALARTEIPYRSQYASPELIASGAITLADDPRWQEAGAATPQEYARWARRGCGMACLQMILAARGDSVPPLVNLARDCTRYGGYEEHPRGGYGPLIYAGFVEYVTAELGLSARVAAPLPLPGLLDTVRGEEVVLASVSSEIRTLAPAPARRGGHLVLVVDAGDDRVCFHDPAGHHAAAARAVWLETEVFERFYAARGIAVTLARR